MDSISNLIIKIKNASERGLATVTMPHTRLIESIVAVLEKEGFVTSSVKKGKKVGDTLKITILYDADKNPKVSGVERVSKLSKRLYAGFKEIKPVKSGYGMMILTTPKGIMTDKDAKREKVGGELLFKIW